MVDASQYLDNVEGYVVASARPVSLGRHARVGVAGGVSVRPAPDELFERSELLLEDIVMEVRASDLPIVVALGAVVYLHPGCSVQRVVDGGAVYLARGAWVEDLDEVAVARGEITVASWWASSSVKVAAG